MKKKIILSKFLVVVMISTASLSHATLQNGEINTASNAGLELSEVETMTSMLKSIDPFVRANAAQELGELGGPDVTIPLIKALKDSNTYVRAYAAEALGKINKVLQ